MEDLPRLSGCLCAPARWREDLGSRGWLVKGTAAAGHKLTVVTGDSKSQDRALLLRGGGGGLTRTVLFTVTYRGQPFSISQLLPTVCWRLRATASAIRMWQTLFSLFRRGAKVRPSLALSGSRKR